MTTDSTPYRPSVVEARPLLSLLLQVSRSGHLGPLVCGMPLQPLEQILGPAHDRQRQTRPRRWRPRLHYWDDLEVLICHGMVIAFTIPTWGEELTLPTALTGWATSTQPSLLSRTEMLTALAAAGLTCHAEPRLVLDDDAEGIHVLNGGVDLVFLTEGGESRLSTLSKRRYDLDTNDHSPRQGRLPA
ncbi:hypothetical protein CLV92_102142 [Kineococcus xinjiangensis]|uniref:Uncharacterized protein n=1 Tax=Kineococcus xinjiangensis TaxID=512762 RepID=A0A2S6IUP8_9ACTN|nr:hypothetical protein [Kineococcus xinjiangensis]PPK97991.1 hypothetical protein CLV92_102142 [Kineococcus xinjiangensis]